ncbi:MAG TPA: MarC family protein [Puia sp.]|nr:MarC family protein [Puia sp.]
MFDFGQISFKQIVTITFTLFAVIDMLGSIPVLVSLKEKIGGTIRSTQATVVSGLLMIVFLFFGQQFLNVLSLDVRSFAVAGSIVIFILGLEMVLGMEFFKTDKNTQGSSVVPIAFPIIAGSGTLTTIMSLKADYADINILIGILINCVVIYIVLKSLDWIEKVLGPNGLIVVRKFFGVVLLAIAVKIFATNASGLIK